MSLHFSVQPVLSMKLLKKCKREEGDETAQPIPNYSQYLVKEENHLYYSDEDDGQNHKLKKEEREEI